MKNNDETFPVKFIKYDAGNTTLEIPRGYGPFTQVIVFVERNRDVVFAHLNFSSQIDQNTYVFETVDIQVVEYVAAGKKPEVNSGRSEARIGQIFVTSIVSDFAIEASLKSAARKLEYLKGEITAKIQDRYDSAVTVFMHEKKPNPRMEYFSRDGAPYFFPELRSPVSTEERALAEYMNDIHARDFALQEKQYRSEICVPLLFKLMLPFGYIQVNSKEPLSQKDFSAIRKLGMSASTVLSNSTTVIKALDELMPAADVSSGGLSIVYRDKSMIRHFCVHSSIVFDVMLPGGKKSSMMAVVRNISQGENGIYRVGCEIKNIDPIGEVNYEEFLSSVTV
jgi:hypothetical protein